MVEIMLAKGSACGSLKDDFKHLSLSADSLLRAELTRTLPHSKSVLRTCVDGAG